MIGVALLFICLAWIMLAVMPNRSKVIDLVVATMAAAGLISFALLVDSSIAQDKSQYFSWYQSSHLSDKFVSQDILFTLFLGGLPVGLSEDQLFMVLVGTLVVLIWTQLTRMRTWLGVRALAVSSTMVFLATDRIFLDLLFNTLRSSAALVILIFVISSKATFARFFFTVTGAGLHTAAFLSGLSIFFLSAVVAKAETLPRWLFTISVLIFSLRYFGVELLPSQAITAINLFSIDDERLLRSLQAANVELSTSLYAQFFLALILLGCLHVYRTLNGSSLVPSEKEVLNLKLLNIGFISASVILVLYPIYPLAIRFALIPLIIFPMLASRRVLFFITGLKLILLYWAVV